MLTDLVVDLHFSSKCIENIFFANFYLCCSSIMHRWTVSNYTTYNSIFLRKDFRMTTAIQIFAFPTGTYNNTWTTDILCTATFILWVAGYTITMEDVLNLVQNWQRYRVTQAHKTKYTQIKNLLFIRLPQEGGLCFSGVWLN